MPLLRLLTALLLLSACSCGPRYSRLTFPAKVTKKTAPALYRARFETTQGIFVIEVHRDWSPLGADRFYNLVRGGFYDGQRFFRTLPQFVVQWGLPAKPAVSKAWDETTRIKDDPVTQSNSRGFVSFATSGPNTRTAQIFVNMADNARLDKLGFSPFGKVVEGMDVFAKFYSGYGEGAPRGKGPEQKRIREEGEAYLARDFPQLDRIKRARIIRVRK